MKKAIAAVLLMLFLWAPVSHAAEPADLLPFEDLTPGLMKGFGDRWNRYPWSMIAQGDSVYVGTWNQKLKMSRLMLAMLLSVLGVDGHNDKFEFGLGTLPVSKTQGGEIWRYSLADGAWTKIVDHGFGDRANTGYRVARQYGGRLYFGSANYRSGPQILSIGDNGSTVAELEIAPGKREQWQKNNSIRAMEVYNGRLYIGTENDEGAELWVYDGSDMKRLFTFSELSLGEMRLWGGYLFAGMWDFENRTRLYRLRLNDAGSVLASDDVTPPPMLETTNLGIMSMEIFQDRLYCGTSNYRSGFTLVRFDHPDTAEAGWSIITADGFGEPFNMYAWSLKAFDGFLYLGTFNAWGGGAQLWYSADGSSWTNLTREGFGSRMDWGIRTMAVAGQRLFLGIASSVPGSALPGTPGGLKILASSPPGE